ncbi:MAG: sulfite exporter TauE/SafE family protein [Oceanospirillaceae bacterium]|nr:sulfite exporter TauE/SafE family protein [Oceanospirillaceae bacterium]
MPFEWIVLISAGLITGFSKFSVGGMGLLILPVIMIAFPGPQALGIILPMYIITDLLAVISYRKNIHWPLLIKLLPFCFVGIFAGGFVLAKISASDFNIMLSVLILGMLVLGIILDNSKSSFMRHPISTYITGFIGGVVSMISNAAGPIFSIYFMEQKLDKKTYVSTRSWAFMFINLAKIPALYTLGLLNMESTMISLQTIPGLIIGAGIGYWVLGKLALTQFKWLIRIMAGIAAVKLMI